MQVLQERKPVRSWAIADTASEPAIDRIKKPELYAELKSAGGTTGLCLKTTGGSWNGCVECANAVVMSAARCMKAG